MRDGTKARLAGAAADQMRSKWQKRLRLMQRRDVVSGFSRTLGQRCAGNVRRYEARRIEKSSCSAGGGGPAAPMAVVT
jgi:hypothetical protein